MCIKKSIMKQSILFLFLMLSYMGQAQGNDSVKLVLNKIIDHAERASLYRDRVKWNALKDSVQTHALNASNVKELAPALKYLLKEMGDEHARVFHNNQIIAYYYGNLKEHLKGFNVEVYNRIQSGQVYNFEAKILERNIGYVRIVGLPMGDNLQMTRAIEDAICKLSPKKIDKWIVDLRYNGGGNLNPMAEGLAQIIGEGYVGGSQGLTSTENDHWKISNGNFYNNDYSIESKLSCKFKKNSKVAVLTSMYTASSGEAMAVMFKGKKNTRFFGEKTLGMITVTDWHVIDSSTAMTISVGYYKDRNGIIYDKYVDVDEVFEFIIEPLAKSDITIHRAIAWLKNGK